MYVCFLQLVEKEIHMDIFRYHESMIEIVNLNKNAGVL